MRNFLPSLGAVLAAVALSTALLGGERPDLGTRTRVRPRAPRSGPDLDRKANGPPSRPPWPDPPPPRGREIVGPVREGGFDRRARFRPPPRETEALRLELALAWRKMRGDHGTRRDLWHPPDGAGPSPGRLAALFPDSDLARSYREYAEIRGGEYFGYRLREVVGDFKYRPEREIPGFAAWVERYPGHPGQDDASYRLGRCFGIEGRGIEAVRWFRRAQAVPDGDMAWRAAIFELLFLDLLLPDDDLRYLAETGDPPAAWSWGTRLLRAGRYRDARAFLRAGGRATWWAERSRAVFDAASELEDLERAVRRAPDPAARARALYELGRRQYHDEYLYENVLWTRLGSRDEVLLNAGVLQLLGHDGAPEIFRENWRAGNHRLRARETFLRLAEEHPGSELVPAARYSAAAALAYTIEGRHEYEVVQCPAETRIATAREFLRFAAEFPASTLADDALLAAGRLTRNTDAFHSILGRYPAGDSAGAAVAELAHWWNAPPKLNRVLDNLGRLSRASPYSAAWYAERIERALGFCLGRILRARGEERARAIAEFRDWFSRHRSRLEFDPVAGAWLLF